jgi:hypothetical protein
MPWTTSLPSQRTAPDATGPLLFAKYHGRTITNVGCAELTRVLD